MIFKVGDLVYAGRHLLIKGRIVDTEPAASTLYKIESDDGVIYSWYGETQIRLVPPLIQLAEAAE